MTLITCQNICPRLTYHRPNHWWALQRYTTTRSPSGIGINTCTELLTQLVVSHSCTSQTRNGPFSHRQDKPHVDFLRQTTHPERTCVICFGPTGPGGTLAPTVSHPSGTICNESEQHFFTCTSSSSPQLEHIHKRTVVPDSHTIAPATGELFNAIRPLDRPLASISTHARSSELGSLSVIHAQVTHGTGPSHTDRTNLMNFSRAYLLSHTVQFFLKLRNCFPLSCGTTKANK